MPEEHMGQAQFSFHNGAGKPNPGNRLGAHFPEKSGNPRRAVWRDLAERFCDPRECLASYLALESAEVIAGVKPANLISISNHEYSCGRNPYQLWKRWGREIVGATSLKVHELTDRGSSVLVLLYHQEALSTLLETAPVRAILRRAGYAEDMNLQTLLGRLAGRISSGAFPHEIGVFLGYPLKDVAGFMGLARIPFTCQGPWKIYGNPDASLQLAETFRWCRSRMADDLTNCSSPFECFGFCETEGAFFCHTADNDYQLHDAARSRAFAG
jgi:uncharacterized protein DUF3793